MSRLVPDATPCTIQPTALTGLTAPFAMHHRHLNHQRYTLAAIDDVISRGRWQDWAELRRAALSDRALLDKVERVCLPYVSNPYAQRHHFWMHYAQEHRAAA